MSGAVIVTALIAGFVGSTHCVAMCGGISGLAAAGAVEQSLRQQLGLALAYNAGRLASYAMLGALVAASGSAVVHAVPSLVGPVRLLSGLLIVLIGAQIAFDLRLLQPIERMGGLVWQRIAPLAKGLLPVSDRARALGLGLLWGLLPCGLVYSVLLVSAATASVLAGATAMLAFGAGTLPAMLATGLGGVRLSRLLARQRVRLAAGLLVMAAGLLTIALPAVMMMNPDPGAASHQHIG